MLHYNPRHVSISTMLIFRRTNCIITASGIVTLCKRPYSTPVESGWSVTQHSSAVTDVSVQIGGPETSIANYQSRP